MRIDFGGKLVIFQSDRRVKKRNMCEHILLCLHFISEHVLTFTDRLLMSTTLFDILSAYTHNDWESENSSEPIANFNLIYCCIEINWKFS